MAAQALTIGQLAARFDLNTSAIRYYERTGVLPAAERVSGQRRYGPEAVRRLEVLEIAKRVGFTLEEARLLLERTDSDSPAFEVVRELAERKLPEVDALIERAQAMRRWLVTATSCPCSNLDACELMTSPRTSRAR